MLKFYTDLSFFDVNEIDKNIFDLPQTYFFVSLLPFDLKKKFLNNINDEAKKTFECILNVKEKFVDQIENCDYILLPPFKFWEKFENAIKKYSNYINYCNSNHNKKFIIFYSGPDNDTPIDLDPNIFIFFRCGSYKSLHKNFVYGIPTFCQDYYRGKVLNKKLSLSFCGYPLNNQFKRYFIDKLSHLDYSNFIIRNYWCDFPDYNLDLNSSLVQTPHKSKLEYIDNIEQNLYGVAIRGATNYSHRLNEIFMMGRIPVLFNTDCILPFENLIDYEKYTVYITEKKCPNFTYVDKLIREHYDSYSEIDLMNLQKENRRIWETYFTVDGAYNKTLELLVKIHSLGFLPLG